MKLKFSLKNKEASLEADVEKLVEKARGIIHNKAFVLASPMISFNSSKEASRMRLTLLKWRKSVVFVFSPIPLMESSSDFV